MSDEPSPVESTIFPERTIRGEKTIGSVPAGLLPPPPVPDDPRLPRVDGYDVLAEVGSGGMGVVYKALHLQLKRVVALKMLRPSVGLSSGEWDSLLARFRREAEALARLRHPNIVEVYDIGETPAGTPFFSLEFCSGGSLDGKLGGTPLLPDEAASLLRTLAQAMHAAHADGIIHRDLKPANVLLHEEKNLPPRRQDAKEERQEVKDKEREEEQAPTSLPSPDSSLRSSFASLRLGGRSSLIPKITDFGLARKLDEVSQTHSGAIFGTPSYMAPEQAQGRSHEAGPAADIWALGAILYECLTGRPPFKAASVTDTLIQVLHDEPAAPRQLNHKVPRDLETICLKCLHKEPARRYSDAGALADDLGRFRRGESIQARSTGVGERAWRWTRRHPAVTVLLTALVATLVVGVAGLFAWQDAEFRRRSQQQEHRQEALARAHRQEDAAETLLRSSRLLRAGDFPRVPALLKEAIESLPDDPGLSDEHTRLRERLERLERLAQAQETFRVQSEAAWFFSGEEHPPATRRACELALSSFGVLEQPAWWSKSPASDLTALQQKELHSEVYRLLLLLGALRVQQAIGKMLWSNERVPLARAAEEAMARARAMESAGLVKPCRTIALLEKGARSLAGSATGKDAKPVLVEPRDDVDAFFIGVVHVFIGRHKTDFLTRMIRLLGAKDFDFETPLSTALTSLRRAVQADPEQYWAWFMLGRALVHDGTDPQGAELAFSTCVLLRPDYSRGYEHRALALVIQSVKTKDRALRQNLLARASRDSVKAEELAPFEPSTWWVRGEMARVQGMDKQALEDYSHALLLEEQLSERASRRNLLSDVRATIARVRAADRDNPDARTLLALILMETESNGPKRALTDLSSVLKDRPNHPLALLARGRALERQEQWGKALAAYDSVPKTQRRWQQVERQRGRERALMRLGRTKESDQARRQAEHLDSRLRKQSTGLGITSLR